MGSRTLPKLDKNLVNIVNNVQSVWYTNSDQLLNKLDELKLRIANATIKPKIIAITEVNPKNRRYPIQISELTLEGYMQPIYNAEGRGICIYIAKSLDFISTMSTQYSTEVILNLTDTDKLQVSCHYRSPTNNTEANNMFINDMTTKLNTEHSHKLILGDFNMPKIDWENMQSTDQMEQKCLDALNDKFMYQHVNAPTRFRNNQHANILDLILTNEEHMITDGVNIEPPLGSSDHATLTFNYQCYSKTDKKTHTTYKYDKADFVSMKRELEVDWEELFQNKTTNEAWEILQKRLKASVDNNIPKHRHNPSQTNIKKKPIWMSYKALTKVKKKHKAWQRYMTTQDGQDYQTYARARNQAKNEVRKALKDYEKSIASEIKTNPKKFWSYVNSKLKTKSEIPQMKKPDGTMTTSNQEKALNNFFTSVFTKEHGQIP